MNKISCLLVDDEELALDVLEHYMERLDDFQVVKRCCNVLEANQFLQNNQVDLIFLDIQMPVISGLEWVKKMENRPCFVFCTAFEKFALEGYDVDAVDYLLKPFSFERFRKAALKAKEKIEAKHIKPFKEEYINIRSERKTYKIAIDDILYFQSLSNYYTVVTKDKKHIAYGSLTSLEEEVLPKKEFIRIHKSYIVAINKIKATSGNAVMIQNHLLPVGKKYREVVEQII